MSIKEIHLPVALQVPKSQEGLARAEGARWNAEDRTLEARNPAVLYKCRKWAAPEKRLGLFWKLEWLDVPYHQNERARRLGARFNNTYSCWYAPLGGASLSTELNPYRMRWHRKALI
jgi:Domain of unknown function (DUF5710)